MSRRKSSCAKRAIAWLLTVVMVISVLPVNSLGLSVGQASASETGILITPIDQSIVYGQNEIIGYDLEDLFEIEGINISELEYETDYIVECDEENTTSEYRNASYNSALQYYSFTPQSSGVFSIKLQIKEDPESERGAVSSTVKCTIERGTVDSDEYYLSFNGGTSVAYGEDEIVADVCKKIDGTKFVSATLGNISSLVVYRFSSEGNDEFTTTVPKEVGTYNVKADVQTTSLWNGFTVEGKLVIEPKTIEITAETQEESYVYGDESLDSLVMTYDVSAESLEYDDEKDDLGIELSADVTTKSKAGSYKITATAENDNYSPKVIYDEETDEGYVKIVARPVTVSWPAESEEYPYSFDYSVEDNQAVKHNVEYAQVTGLLEGDSVGIKYEDASASLPGEYTAKVTGLTGEKADCYRITNDLETLKKEWEITYDYTTPEDIPEAVIEANTVGYKRMSGAKWYSGEDVYLVAGEGVHISLKANKGWSTKVRVENLVPGKNTVTYYLKSDENDLIVAKYDAVFYYDNTAPEGTLTFKGVEFAERISKENYSNKFFVNETSNVSYTGSDSGTDDGKSGLYSIEYRIRDTEAEETENNYISYWNRWNTLYISDEAYCDEDLLGELHYGDLPEMECEVGFGSAADTFPFITNSYENRKSFLDAKKDNPPKDPYDVAEEAVKDMIPPSEDATEGEKSTYWKTYYQAFFNAQMDSAKWSSDNCPQAKIGSNVIELRVTDWAGNKKIISTDNIFVFEDLLSPTAYKNELIGFGYDPTECEMLEEGKEAVFVKSTDFSTILCIRNGEYTLPETMLLPEANPFRTGDNYISKVYIKKADQAEGSYRELTVGTDYICNYNEADGGNGIIYILASALSSYNVDDVCDVKIEYKPFGYTIPEKYNDAAELNNTPNATVFKIQICRQPGWLEVNHVNGLDNTPDSVYTKVYDGVPYNDFTYKMPQGGTVNVSYALKPETGLPANDAYIPGMPSDAGEYVAKFHLEQTNEMEAYTVLKNFTITKRKVTAIMTANDKPYDGIADAELDSIHVDTGIEGKELLINPEAVVAKFADANAGKSKAVSADGTLRDDVESTLSGSDKYENYDITYENGVADINPAPVTVTLPDVYSLYGENHQEKLEYEMEAIAVTGLVGEDTYESLQVSNYSTTATSKSNVKKSGELYLGYPVTATAGNTNYNVDFDGEIIIKPLIAQFDWDYIEDETEYLFSTRDYKVKATVANNCNNNKFSFTYQTEGTNDGNSYNDASNKASEIGEYRTTVTSLGNDNFTLSNSTTKTCDWAIEEYQDDKVATVSEVDGTPIENPDENTFGWYRLTEDVVLGAPDGYLICKKTEPQEWDWDSEITLDSLSEGDNEIEYYLRNIYTGYVTNRKSIVLKTDTTAPAGELTVGAKTYDSRIEELIYKLFHKGEVEMSITADDSTSGIATIEYAFADENMDVEEITDWVTYESAFELKANEVESANGFDKFVYARITDKAGNITIINSDGVVLYNDSVYNGGNITYSKLSLEDKTIAIALNENEIKDSLKIYSDEELTSSVATLQKNTDYIVGSNQIVLKGTTLEKLSADTENYLCIEVNPRGFEVSGDTAEEDKPLKIVVPIIIEKASATITVQDYHKVYDGKKVTKSSYQVNSKGTVSVSYYVDDECTVAFTGGDNNVPVDAGTYYAKYTVAADGDYESAESEPVKVVIERRPVNTYIIAKNKVYDGNTNADVESVVVGDAVAGETFIYESGLNLSFETPDAGLSKEIKDLGTDEEILNNIRFSDSSTGKISNYDMKFITQPVAITRRPTYLYIEKLFVTYGDTYTSIKLEKFKDVTSAYVSPENLATSGLVQGHLNGISIYYQGEKRNAGEYPDIPISEVVVSSGNYDIQLMDAEVSGNKADTIDLAVLTKEVTPLWYARTTDIDGDEICEEIFDVKAYYNPLPEILKYNAKPYNITIDEFNGRLGEDIIVDTKVEPVGESNPNNLVYSASVKGSYSVGIKDLATNADDDAITNQNKNYHLVSAWIDGEGQPRLHTWEIEYLDEWYKRARDAWAVGSDLYRSYNDMYRGVIALNIDQNTWYNSTVDLASSRQNQGYKISLQNESYESEYWHDSITYDEEGIHQVNYSIMDQQGYITSILNSQVKIDKTAPNACVTIETGDESSESRSWLENIFYGIFSSIEGNQGTTVKVTAEDPKPSEDITPSGVHSVYVQIVKDGERLNDGNWIRKETTESEGIHSLEFELNEEGKYSVYTKVIDNAGNEIIVNSNGIVVYTNSKINASTDGFETVDTFERKRLNPLAVENYITTGGYDIASVVCNGKKLEEGTDYTAITNETNSNIKQLTISEEYISKLKAGMYTVTVKYKPYGEEFGSDSIGDEPSITVFHINVVKQAGEVVIDEGYADVNVYNGKAVAYPELSTKLGTGVCTFEFKKFEEDDSSYTNIAPKDAGEYYVRAKVAADDDYAAVISEPLRFRIKKKEIEVKVPIEDKVYDGTKEAFMDSEKDYVLETGVEGDEVSATGEIICEFVSADVGVNKEIKVLDDSNVSFSPGNVSTKVENYAFIFVANDAQITPKEVEVTAQNATRVYGDEEPVFTYDYNEDDLVEGTTLGVVELTTEAVKLSPVGTYDVVLAADESEINPNYSVIVKGANKLSITRRPLTVIWSIDKEYPYTAKSHSHTAEVGNLVDDDNADIILNYTGNTEAALGEYTAKITGFEGTGASNYMLTETADIEDTWKIVSSDSEEDVEAEVVMKDADGNAVMVDSSVWYNAPITLWAPEGYYISTSDDSADHGWSKSTEFNEEADTSEGVEFTYYLKNIETGAITAAKSVVLKLDMSAPTGQIAVKDKVYNGVVNPISYNTFVKDSLTVTVTTGQSISGIASIEYMLAENYDTYLANKDNANEWKMLEDDEASFDLEDVKSAIFVRITNGAGNQTVINTDGVVIYQDTEIPEGQSLVYEKTTTDDVTILANLNGNTVDSVMVGKEKLSLGEDYKVIYEPNEEGYGQIVLLDSYLNTLKAKDEPYSVSVTYKPLDAIYADGISNGDTPQSSVLELVVKKKAQTTADLEIHVESKEYDGQPIVPEIITQNTGRMTLYYKEVNEDDSAYIPVAPKSVGDYVVKVEIESDEYFEANEGTANFSITKRPVVIQWPEEVYYYDSKVQTIKPTIQNLVEGDICNLTVIGNTATSVGAYTAEVVGVDNPNYTLQNVTGTSFEWNISYIEDNVEPEMDEAIASGKWSSGDVSIKAPEGYLIHRTDDGSTGEGTSEILITEEGVHQLKYYLEKISDGTITEEKELVVKVDKSAPTGSVIVSGKEYTSTEKAPDTSYQVFVKDAIKEVINAIDTVDENVTVEYQKVPNGEAYDPNGEWTSANEFNVEMQEKAVLYFKLTDAAGHVTIFNTGGLVVYKDSERVTETVDYAKDGKSSASGKVNLNGNTVASITNGEVKLTAEKDYTVGANGEITFTPSYLNSLPAGKHVLSISYNPLGECYVEAEGNEAPAVTTMTLFITDPEAEAKAKAEAEEKAEAELKKPETVELNALALNEGLKVKQTGKKITVAWGTVDVADGYEVYVQYCGKKFESNPTSVTTNATSTSVSVTKINGKKLNLKKNYKIFIVAYKNINGKKIKLGKTITAHIVGEKNQKFTNVKAVKVKESKVTLKKGKTSQIKSRTILVDKTKKSLTDAHAKEFRYASSNTSVAQVNAKGKITAVGNGSCIVYVYARNGYAKKVKVTVK